MILFIWIYKYVSKYNVSILFIAIVYNWFLIILTFRESGEKSV